jgi:hypothetical protein
MRNHPSTEYMARLKLVEKLQRGTPLKELVIYRFKAANAVVAMAQPMKIDDTMLVFITL